MIRRTIGGKMEAPIEVGEIIEVRKHQIKNILESFRSEIRTPFDMAKGGTTIDHTGEGPRRLTRQSVNQTIPVQNSLLTKRKQEPFSREILKPLPKTPANTKRIQPPSEKKSPPKPKAPLSKRGAKQNEINNTSASIPKVTKLVPQERKSTNIRAKASAEKKDSLKIASSKEKNKEDKGKSSNSRPNPPKVSKGPSKLKKSAKAAGKPKELKSGVPDTRPTNAQPSIEGILIGQPSSPKTENAVEARPTIDQIRNPDDLIGSDNDLEPSTISFSFSFCIHNLMLGISETDITV